MNERVVVVVVSVSRANEKPPRGGRGRLSYLHRCAGCLQRRESAILEWSVALDGVGHGTGEIIPWYRGR